MTSWWVVGVVLLWLLYVFGVGVCREGVFFILGWFVVACCKGPLSALGAIVVACCKRPISALGAVA